MSITSKINKLGNNSFSTELKQIFSSIVRKLISIEENVKKLNTDVKTINNKKIVLTVNSIEPDNSGNILLPNSDTSELESPNKTKYKLVVDDEGNLSTVKVE